MPKRSSIPRPITPQIIEVEVADQIITPRKLLPAQLPELFLRDSAGAIIYDSTGAPVTIPKIRIDDINIVDLPGPIGRFIPRNCGAASDFIIGAPFIADGFLHVNQLNLSAIVPRDAIAVVLICQVDPMASLLIQVNQTNQAGNRIGISFLVGNYPYLINLDTIANDRCLDVILSGGALMVGINVAGWVV